MSRYFVTGGAGFIGSHICARLVQEGEEVTVYDDLSTGRRENLAGIGGNLSLVEGDVRDREALGRALPGADYVIHLAALPSVPRSVKDPLSTHDVCATGTLNVLEAARACGVRRLVYASSSAVYGESETLPKHEDLALAPVSPYGAAKLAGEAYAQVFYRVYGMSTVSLRYFNVFGPRQDPHSPYAAAIASFVTRMLSGQRPRVFGNGEQSRDFTFVEDVVEANLLACRTDLDGGIVCNVAGGKRTRLNEILRALAELLPGSPAPEYLEPRSGDILDSEADIRRATEVLGYRPSVSLREGLRRTLQWYRGIHEVPCEGKEA